MGSTPYKQQIPCKHPGCSNLISFGRKYCNVHRSQYPEVTRSAGSRGYGSKWQRISKRYLRNHPLCVKCGRPATVVDHIQPHRGDQALMWDERNYQALCKPCHDRKTWTEDKNPVYRY